MIVIYGSRSAGKVDARDGEYALTRFAHMYWMPLIPIGGQWMTSRGGHRAKLNWRSVFSAYARSWGTLATVAFAATGSIGAAVCAGSLAAMSWTFRDVRGATARRRSDLNRLAFGTRCDPTAMPHELVAALRPQVDARWAAVSEGQSPSDVARFGTDDPTRAAAAYGVLRLSALTLPRAQAAEAEADAAKIAAGYREDRQLGDGGPYRELAEPSSPPPPQPPSP